MKLDLSRCKKISSDEKSTTFKNPAGHKVVVVHAALSPSERKKVKEFSTKYQDSEEEIKGYAVGGEVEKEEKKSWVPEWMSKPGHQIISEKLAQENAPKISREVAEMSMADPNSPLARDYPGELQNAAKYYGLPAAVGTQSRDPAVATMAPQQELAQPSAPTLAPQAAQSLAPQPQEIPQQSLQVGNYGNALLGDINKARGAANEYANAATQQAQMEMDAAKQQEQFFQKASEDYTQKFGSLNNELKNAISDWQQGHVNPERYMESMSSGKKVATAIGLILGGMGSGLTGQENAAQKFLQQQIDRDIESQKNSIGNKESLVSAYFKQFGNLKEATDMAFAVQTGIYGAKLRQAATKTTSPKAKMDALSAAIELETKASDQIQKIAKQQTLNSVLNMANSGPNTEQGYLQKMNAMRSVDKDLYKEANENYLPGIGVARIKPSDKDKEKIAALDGLKKGLTQLQSRAATIGTTVPGSQADMENKALQSGVMMQAKIALDMGAIQGADMGFLEKMVPNPGAFLTKGTVAQLEATKRSMDKQLDSVYNKLGVDKFQGNKLRVSNGKQTLDIDPNDLQAAMRDGYKRVQ